MLTPEVSEITRSIAIDAMNILRQLRAEHPGVRPFNDAQPWEFNIQEAPLPDTWALVIGIPTRSVPPGHYGRLSILPEFSVRVVNFSGPARLFVMGWDPGAGEVRIAGRKLIPPGR